MATETLYVISVAAERSGVHPQTLRIYERKGLIEPARTTGGNRRYTEADIALLQRIAELTASGMNLVGVKRMLDLERRVAELEEELRQLRGQSSGSLVPLRQSVAVFSRNKPRR
jgi:MerR family transcriptional regulator/heat shock protein HspR